MNFQSQPRLWGRFDRGIRQGRQKTARLRLPQPHHDRTQPAGRAGFPLPLRHIRHLQQSIVQYHQYRRRME